MKKYIYRGSKKFFEDVPLITNPRTGMKSFDPKEDFSVIRQYYLGEKNTIWSGYEDEEGLDIVQGYNMAYPNKIFIQEDVTTSEDVSQAYCDLDYTPNAVFCSENNIEAFMTELRDTYKILKTGGKVCSMGYLIDLSLAKAATKFSDHMQYKEEQSESDSVVITTEALAENFFDFYEPESQHVEVITTLISLHKTLPDFHTQLLIDCVTLFDPNLKEKVDNFRKTYKGLENEK